MAAFGFAKLGLASGVAGSEGKDMARGIVVPRERLLLARLAKEQQAAIRGCTEIAAAGDRAIRQLEQARAALQVVSDECARAGARFEESRRFRDACAAAAALDSVEEMARRRDELIAQRDRRKTARAKT